MYKRKKNLFVSKRHIRRIIADKTNIDIAGSSKQILEQSHSSIKSYYNLDKIADERIDALNINSNDISNNVDNVIMPLENENHYQHQDDNDFHNDFHNEIYLLKKTVL